MPEARRLLRAASPFARAALLAGVAATVAGCGKSLPSEGTSRGAGVATVASSGAVGPSGLVMANTTRLGGTDPVADAAASALATYPGLTPATRPEAVVLVDERDWSAALAAAALASAPLGAPLLYAEGDALPTASAQALATLRPRGSRLLGGAQVIELGTAAAPAGYKRSPVAGAGRRRRGDAGGAGGATAHDCPRQPAAPRDRVGADGPRALAMPAAGLAAETGAPILPVERARHPAATGRRTGGLHRPTIYAVGPPVAIGHAVLAALARLGPVRRIEAVPGRPAAGATAAGQRDRGRALPRRNLRLGRRRTGPRPGVRQARARSTRPPRRRCPRAGTSPLLLLEAAGQVPTALASYLGRHPARLPPNTSRCAASTIAAG